MTSSGPLPSQAEQMIRRVSPEGRARAKRLAQEQARARRTVMLRMSAGVALVLLVALALDQWRPIGGAGALVALMLAIIVGAVIWLASRKAAITSAVLTESDLSLLPQRTEAWLEAQRPALPAPATRVVDDIARKLQELPRQLTGLDAREPVAEEVRKLLSRELPDLIEGYRSVPGSLRRSGIGGMADADSQLVEGLSTIDTQIGRLTEQLGSGAFDKLATNNLYLGSKYRGDDELRG